MEYTCINCNKKTEEDLIFGDKHYCEDCYNELFGFCDDCGTVVEIEKINNIGDKFICKNCLNDKYFVCDDCGEYKPNTEEIQLYNDKYICESCYSNNGYFTCEQCENVFPEDCYGDNGLCQDCYDENERENEEDKPTECPDNKRYYEAKNKYKKIAVGLEIEAVNGDYRNVYDDLTGQGFGVTDDGSLSGNGIEVQIPACNTDKLGELVKIACTSLKENDFHINKTCGLHIHTEFKTRKENIKKLFLTAIALDDLFFTLQPTSRRVNNYCRKISTDFDFWEISKLKPSTIDLKYYSKYNTIYHDRELKKIKKEKYNSSRYYGFNLHSIFYRGTLEVRHHSGTIEPEKIMAFINLIVNIIKWVKNSFCLETLRYYQTIPSKIGKFNYLTQLIKLDENSKKFLLYKRLLKFNRLNYVRDNLH